MSLVWILGASDVEMALIERTLTEDGQRVLHATAGGKRCHPGNAYKADGVDGSGVDTAEEVVMVECDLPGWFSGDPAPLISHCDHHRLGDPGYGKSPEAFMDASSIGQVLCRMWGCTSLTFQDGKWQSGLTDARWSVGTEAVLTAAADHCLEAAYRGRCPGVDPDALMAWRAASRAAQQKRPVAEVVADIDTARSILRQCVGASGICPLCDSGLRPDGKPCTDCDGSGCICRRPYADLTGRLVPELPEAACREGIPYIATATDPDGRIKRVLGAAPPELVKQFLAGEIIPGLVGCYGDPARGFAGGYPS